ncbi:MAG: hypothetical protein JJE23_02015 [Thermoleophilia bacterium]|jgi:hypothetical protein|nr:hypothetical protein [Thermoleophilia bacterium]TFG71987.1 MAG: hypothetical protein E4H22_03510 [Solirubrobacterales bacterium]
MGLRLGRHNFTRVVYDYPSDVLYASLPGVEPTRRQATPEQDVWLFDDRDRFIGVRVLEPRRRWERDGALWVSLPTGERERAAGVEAALRGGG